MIAINIEMPTKCALCPCYDSDHEMCNITGVENRHLEIKPNDCPLIEIVKTSDSTFEVVQ